MHVITIIACSNSSVLRCCCVWTDQKTRTVAMGGKEKYNLIFLLCVCLRKDLEEWKGCCEENFGSGA